MPARLCSPRFRRPARLLVASPGCGSSGSGPTAHEQLGSRRAFLACCCCPPSAHASLCFWCLPRCERLLDIAACHFRRSFIFFPSTTFTAVVFFCAAAFLLPAPAHLPRLVHACISNKRKAAQRPWKAAQKRRGAPLEPMTVEGILLHAHHEARSTPSAGWRRRNGRKLRPEANFYEIRILNQTPFGFISMPGPQKRGAPPGGGGIDEEETFVRGGGSGLAPIEHRRIREVGFDHLIYIAFGPLSHTCMPACAHAPSTPAAPSNILNI